MIRPLSRAVALVTLVVMLCGPLVETASAAFGWDPIDCCCGEHAGDEACGCPDCPAGHQHDDDREQPRDDETPGMRTCGVTGHVAVPGGFVDAVLPVPAHLIAPLARILPGDTPLPPTPLTSDRPEKPPS